MRIDEKAKRLKSLISNMETILTELSKQVQDEEVTRQVYRAVVMLKAAVSLLINHL